MSDVNVYQYLFKCVIINNCTILINIVFMFYGMLTCVGLKKSCCLGSFQFTVNSTMQCELFNSDSGFCIQDSLPHSYLLFLCFLQISPFLCKLAEVHFIHLLPHISNSIMFGEPVEVIHCHDQRLSSELCVWNLQTEYIWVCIYLTPCSMLLNDYCPNSTLWICMLWPL